MERARSRYDGGQGMSVHELDITPRSNVSSKTGLHLVWKVLLNAARAARKQGNDAEARRLYEQTLKAVKEYRGSSNEDVLAIEEELKNLQTNGQPQAKAETKLVEVVADASLEADFHTAWNDHRAHADQHKRDKNFAESEKAWREALDETYEFQSDDPRIARSLEGLAEVLWLQHKYDEAEKNCEQLLKFYESNFGLENFQVATVANNLALLSQFQRNYGAAEKYFKRAIEIRTKLFGENHPDVLNVMANYANLLTLLSRPEEAAAIKERSRLGGGGRWAISGRWKAYAPVGQNISASHNTIEVAKREGDDSLLGWSQLRARAMSLASEGNDLASLKVWQEALNVYEKMMNESDPRLVATLSGIADCLCNLARYTEAEPVMERAIYLKRKNLQLPPSNLARSILRLAKLYYLQGKYDDAEPALQKYIEIQASEPNAQTDVALGYYNIAQLELARGRYDQAEDSYQKVLVIRQELLGEDHPDTVYVRNALKKITNIKAKR
jgi:tetratricopeptide (TPR) repeat protein